MRDQDSHTSLADLKEHVRRFCEEREWDKFHSAKELAIGIVTEAAELLEHFRFKSESEIARALQRTVFRKAIAEEMSDVLYFLLRLAQKYDIDLSREFRSKMRENEAKYPVARSRGVNRKYSEL